MFDVSFDSRDEFSRGKIAEKVIKLFSKDVDLSPLILDGGWGTGKTEFTQKLINLWGKDTNHIIYIDAFKSDHADEPLLTILAEVLKLLPESQMDSVVKKVLPAVRYGLKTVFKAGVGHILKQDTDSIVEGYDKEVKQLADKAIDASIESLLKDHVKASESLNSLQETLKNISDEKEIVIFIDELDRCRPNYAVKMLETIKHTFDVKGVHFILVTNSTQLKASINHCYGSSVNANQYLDKFIKYRISLPERQSPLNYTAPEFYSVMHFKNLTMNSSNLGEYFSDMDELKHLIRSNALSLREVETFVRHLEVYEILTNEKLKNSSSQQMIIQCYGIFIAIFKPSLCKKIIERNFYVSDFEDVFNISRFPQEIITERNPDFHLVLIYLIASYKQDLDSLNIDETNKEKWSNYIYHTYSSSEYYIRNNILKPLIDAMTTIHLA